MAKAKRSGVSYVCVDTDEQAQVSLPEARRNLVKAYASDTVKADNLYIWNEKYKRWHKSLVELKVPFLIVTEYEDPHVDIREEQLLHLQQRWYHGSLSRREAKCILQDYARGNGSFLVRASESYHGKFAISFLHESRVRHIVVESKPDSVTHMMYHITPNGPYFVSLYELIEKARQDTIIQNHVFDIVLTDSPPKPDCSWLHHETLTSSQAHHMMRNEYRDGAFFVYKTLSTIVPYVLLFWAAGSVHEHLVVSVATMGLSLNGVVAPVIHKLIDYFMENPIVGSTVLKYPVLSRNSRCSNCALTVKSYVSRSGTELSFGLGALLTDVHQRTKDWCLGSYRGTKNKWFPLDCIRFLTNEELLYVKEVHTDQEEEHRHIHDVYIIDFVKQDFTIDVTVNEATGEPDLLKLTSHSHVPAMARHDYLLSAATGEELRQWYRVLYGAGLIHPEGIVCNKRNSSKEKSSNCAVS